MFIAKMEAICVLVCIVSCWCPVTGRNCHPPWNWWPVKHHWGHGSWCVSGVFHVGFGLLNGSVSLVIGFVWNSIYIYPETFRFWMYVYKLSSCNSLWPRVYPEKSSSKQFSHVWWVSLPRNKFCHKDCLLLVGETQHIVIKRFSGCQKNGLYIAEGQNMKNTIENPSL